ncbi:ankyrin [Amniculicola lignicola CBS 123094]|uniref:Ankyrin n=1 Tax=Amniculicola lignicola CBS 123094 TaxID=1392246 RepID=A0A6A5W9T6_9PLEO|nr:ankyrin [Amniculicola lignicola CBS 123094]
MFTAFPRSNIGSWSPICFAICAELDDLVNYLLPMFPHVNSIFADGSTCLTVAASCNRVDVARMLLNQGATVNLPTTSQRATPLHLAAESAGEEVFDLLIEAGADFHARSLKRTTPFYQACRGGSVYIVRRLKLWPATNQIRFMGENRAIGHKNG